MSTEDTGGKREEAVAEAKVKVVVTGASGLLGRSVLAEFARYGDKYDVVGTAFSRATTVLRKVDLCNTDQLTTFLRTEAPKVIIHCAAERRPDRVEGHEEATAKLNVSATATIAAVAKDLGAWVVYISTDYVFDGTSPPYKPEDTPNPLNKYGVSKLAGEKAMLEGLPGAAAVVRVPVLFGPTSKLAESAVTKLALTLVTKEVPDGPATCDTWGQRYPTFCPDVGVVMRQFTEVRLSGAKSDADTSGIFHWSGSTCLTKFQQASLMADILGVDPAGRILRSDDPPAGAPRPKDCRLDTARLQSLGVGHETPVRTALQQVLRPFAPAAAPVANTSA